MTRELTLADIRNILRDGAGAEEGVDLDGDILDTDFADLGYDSLALLETGSRIERMIDVKLDDASVTDSATPRQLLSAVNSLIPAG